MKIDKITCNSTSQKQVQIPDDSDKNIVLYFYPKDSTPGCTTEGQEFRDNIQAFTDANCVIYGVSRDSLKSHENFKTKQNFPFELISDENCELCKTFGVWQLKKNYGKEYMGIVRSTFVVSAAGDILKSWEKVRVAGHVAEVLKFVQSL